MFFSLIKGINRLISKGISNIYLKGTNEKNWRSQNFDFLSLKSLSPDQFFGSSNSRKYHWIFKLLVAIKLHNAFVYFLGFLLLLLLFIIKFVILSFSFLSFIKVSNLRNRILTDQKQKLLVPNFTWNCMYTIISVSLY